MKLGVQLPRGEAHEVLGGYTTAPLFGKGETAAPSKSATDVNSYLYNNDRFTNVSNNI